MTDIIGMTFNRWTVLRLERMPGRKTFYLCRCECGSEGVVRKDQLTRGISKSCGCWKREVAREQMTRLSTTHGLSNNSRTYGVWKGIRKRCLNSSAPGYKNYGGRGIYVCQRWDSYENFLADMGEVPKGMSIDRINVNGNYEPSNCRWADRKTQMNNMRPNIVVEFMGEKRTLKQWAEKLGINYHMLYQRVFRLSWPVEKALTTPKTI